MLTLSRNGQLKFWSCSKCECMAALDVISEVGRTANNQNQGGLCYDFLIVLFQLFFC